MVLLIKQSCEVNSGNNISAKTMNQIQPSVKKVSNCILAPSINGLYLNPFGADVIFYVYNENHQYVEVPAHKNVLTILYSKFNELFLDPSKDKYTVHIYGSSVDGVKQFLQLFYLFEVNFTLDEICDVMNLCKMYELFDFLEICSTYLINHLKTDTICFGYELGILFEQQNLIDFCEITIKKEAADIFKTNAFLECNRKLVQRIFDMNIPNVSPLDKINACLAWAKEECDFENGEEKTQFMDLRTILGDLFDKLPFTSLEYAEFVEIFPQCLNLFKTDELKKTMEFISKKKMTSTNTDDNSMM